MNENEKTKPQTLFEAFLSHRMPWRSGHILSASYRNRGNHKDSIGLHHHRSPIQVFFRRGPPGSGYQIPPLAHKAPKRTLPPSFPEAHSIAPKDLLLRRKFNFRQIIFYIMIPAINTTGKKRQKLIAKNSAKSCWISLRLQKAISYFFVWSPSLLSFPLRFHM